MSNLERKLNGIFSRCLIKHEKRTSELKEEATNLHGEQTLEHEQNKALCETTNKMLTIPKKGCSWKSDQV